MTNTRTITWQTRDGRQVEVTVGLYVPISEALNARTADQTAERAVGYRLRFDGCDCGTVGLTMLPHHPVAVAQLGRKIGVTADNYALIQAAVAEVKDCDEYRASEAMLARAASIRADHAAHLDMMDQAMTDHGRTY